MLSTDNSAADGRVSSSTADRAAPQSYQWEDDQLVSEWLSAQLDANNVSESMLLDNIQCLEREAAMARVRHTVQVGVRAVALTDGGLRGWAIVGWCVV